MAETNQDMASGAHGAATASRYIRWGGNFVLGGAVLVVAVAFIAATLARYGIIAKLSGFFGFMMMLNPSRVLVISGLVVLGLAMWRKTGPRWQAALGTVLAGAMLFLIYTTVILPARSVPLLHDITTNVDSPPEFAALSLREDNLVPFQSMEEWRSAHRQGYPDIGPIVINKSPAEVLADARALAEGKSWTIASIDTGATMADRSEVAGAAEAEAAEAADAGMEAADAAPVSGAGQLEATVYAGYVRFMDDVIVKVTPVEDGSTRVDMRSVSRIGVSDLGYNAARIREFLAELQAM